MRGADRYKGPYHPIRCDRRRGVTEMAEHRMPASRDGSVVLDIGGNIGALVVEVTGDWLGREPDLTPVGATAAIMHTEVRERHVNGEIRYAAVYASVPAGTYTVQDLTPLFTVEGGKVTESRPLVDH
jgi:hypothetical protein